MNKTTYPLVVALLALASPFLSSQTAVAPTTTVTDDEAPRFFATPAAVPKGVVVVAHGLNLRPSKMGAPAAEGTIVAALLGAGYHVFRVTLPGHRGIVAAMQTVTRDQWLAAARDQYASALREATAAAVPLYLVGFSLGALVFEVLMNDGHAADPPVRFDKAVLFAPAVAIKTAAHSIRPLTALLPAATLIPSRSPAAYRAQSGTSLAAYAALFALENALTAARFEANNIPTLVFIDPKDELVSPGKLRTALATFALTAWIIHEVTPACTAPYHHLIIDAASLGAEAWTEVAAALCGFLAS
jgi:esterase/lipase